MSRFVCVHGHFYQPPRENPWLEEVELEDSAHPYHDWNERITAECYRPNAAARVLDGDGYIMDIVNNYAHMSFNFGPTLLAWLERHATSVYEKILEADRESMRRCSGHGNALAQAYNHVILPLARPRDVRTQVIWGVKDFRHRFGRYPEGMWLPETAVDVPSLEALAEAGIRFTILAPHQALRVRPVGAASWREIQGEEVDPTRPYLVRLPSGREIAVFFYHGPIARAVAFEGLLTHGDRLADRLLGALGGGGPHPRLVHLATDGESYGHHHRHGEMALAYALRHMAASGATITNYAAFLAQHPPDQQAEIREGSSWSCAHGVERWRADCGCHSGAHPGWNQAWRGPLRAALDALRDELDARYAARAGALFGDPWAARDAYIDVILDRDRASVEAFLHRQTGRQLEDHEARDALVLLEMQRHAMLMYTSCGWFFDDISGLESLQVLRYAARAAQLAKGLFGDDLEEGLERALSMAKSNLPEEGDGGRIYRRKVRPASVDLARVAAHHVVASVFLEADGTRDVYAYRVDTEEQRRWPLGVATLEVGRVKVSSAVTWESARLCYGALHLGGHSLAAGVRLCDALEEADTAPVRIAEAVRKADVPEALRILDRHFGGATHSLRSLFRDERRRLVAHLMESTLADVDAVVHRLFRQHIPLVDFLVEGGIPVPKALRSVAELSLESDILRSLYPNGDLARAREALEQARAWGLSLDAQALAHATEHALDNVAAAVQEDPRDLAMLERFGRLAQVAREIGAGVDLHNAQNACHEMLTIHWPGRAAAAASGDSQGVRWVALVRELADALRVRVPG